MLDAHKRLIDDLSRDQVTMMSLLTSRIAAVERDISDLPDILGKFVIFKYFSTKLQTFVILSNTV